MELPFYYIVRFNLIGYNNPNEIKIHKYEIKFMDAEPILNRINAFNAFEEYQSFIKENLVIKDGVLSINNISSFENYSNIEAFKEFEQSIEVICKVVESVPNLYYTVSDNLSENELVIHRISSSVFEPQSLMDDLLDEIKFYEYFNFSTGGQEVNIRYYGLDYYDTGEDPDVLDNKILPTPFNWDSAIYKVKPEPTPPSNLIKAVLKNGEGHQVEFKPSLIYNFATNRAGITPKYHAAKTIASFLNSDGGVLLIGISNNGIIQGIKYDYSLFPENQKDKFQLEFDNMIYQFLKPSLKPFLRTDFIKIENEEVFLVFVDKCNQPVFLSNKDEKEFFIRLETSSTRLFGIEEIIQYVFGNWMRDK